MVFSHVNRLIRCIIDCQLQLEDAVSVRHALELARSLAARVWDNSPYQMKQIDAIGEASVRKLAQSGILSIETLQNTEPHRIEHILGHNPPFGQRVLAKAMEFPNLRVSVKEMGKESRRGQWVRIKFKADVGFVNEKLPINFRRKSVYVCFLAETSDGRLIDFRRFASKKLEHGQEILLSVKLVRPTVSIICHAMCDEIAGTSRRAELHLEHFSASCYPTNDSIAIKPTVLEYSKAVVPTRLASKNSPAWDDYDDLDDADLLAALDKNEDIEVIHDIDQIVLDTAEPEKRSLKRAASQVSVDEQGLLKTFKEPVQLANGNWTCQHICKEVGKSCKHKCCVDGVEKPARAGRKKPMKKDAATKGLSDATTVQKPAKTTPFDKARAQAEAKKQEPEGPRTQEAKSTADHRQLTATNTEWTSPVQSKAPAHQYKKGTAPKFSFMQNPYGLSNNLEHAAEGTAGRQEDRSKESHPILLARPKKHFANLSDDEFDFEVDEELEDINIESILSLVDQSVVPEYPGTGMGKKPISPQTKICGSVGVEKVLDESVTGSLHPWHGLDSQPARPMASDFTNAEGHSATVRSSQSKDIVHCHSSPSLGNEADFGAFNAPLTHVSPIATQRWGSITSNHAVNQGQSSKPQEKGLFITGESSSPYKTLAKASEGIEETDEYTDVAVEAFFATLDSAEYDVDEPPAKKQKSSHETGELILFPEAGPELQTSSTEPSSSLVLSGMSRRPLKPLQNERHLQPTASKTVVSGAPEDMSITNEEREDEAKEKEMKKWEGLGDFYEQFGDYVEIVE